MEKATIYDYARMCKSYDDCSICPLGKTTCHLLISKDPDKANEIILKWCEEHPVETRQDRFLKMFPNAKKYDNGVVAACPEWVDEDFCCAGTKKRCSDCCKEFWLAEIDEYDK